MGASAGLRESQHLRIPLKEIELATRNFETFIGRGGYGLVYKCKLTISGKPTTVAVKRLHEEFGQGVKEFLTEIQLLYGQKHPNLISLLGLCDEQKEKIIVYEYAARGSLDQYLRSDNNTDRLSWLQRLRICLGAARGLDHLHNHVGEHQTVIHRDIKSANILLDENWVAKISDLGLSKLTLAGLNRSAVVSNACGTPGYVEPEYINTGIVKKESDVYSFGMVLFEVLCGRLCSLRGHDGLLLTGSLIKQYYEEKQLHKIVDPTLREQMSSESMKIFSAIAYGCLHEKREKRHSMVRVVKELEQLLEIPSGGSEDVDLESNMPSDCENIIQRSEKQLEYTTKKELYLLLCAGILIDNGRKWFSLCKSTGGKCHMLPATKILNNLDILPLLESRFGEVTQIRAGQWYQFECKVEPDMLSSQNAYACYLVFKFANDGIKFDGSSFLRTECYLDGHYDPTSQAHGLMLSPINIPIIRTNNDKTSPQSSSMPSWIEERDDGWMEIILLKSLRKLKSVRGALIPLKSDLDGIRVEGIEFRPMHSYI